MFTVSGRKGAECSLSVGGGGQSVHCQWGRGGLSVHCQWEEGGRVFTVSGGGGG